MSILQKRSVATGPKTGPSSLFVDLFTEIRQRPRHLFKNMNKPAEALAEDLQAVLNGTKDLEAVIEDPRHQNASLGACFHGLQHYLMDGEIRGKDDGYRRMQDGEMRELIRLLRSGASDAVLGRISFLGPVGLSRKS